MGCHTWFYNKRKKQPTIEEAKEYVLNKINENIKIAKRVLNKKKEKLHDKKDKILWDVCNHNFNEVLSYYKECQKEKKDFILLTDKDKIIEKFMHSSMWDKDICPTGLAKFYNGYIYDKVLMYEYFRVPHFPEEVLTCYDDFEMFYLNHYDKCYSNMFDNEEDIRNTMKKFWEDYPEGIVDFG